MKKKVLIIGGKDQKLGRTLAEEMAKLLSNESRRLYVYLMFDIQNIFSQKIGEVKILIHKQNDFKKWKNPDLLKKEAIERFKSESPDHRNSELNVFYTGDFIPYL